MFNLTTMIKGLTLAASLSISLVLADGATQLSPKPYSAKPPLQTPAPKPQETPQYKPNKIPPRPELPPMTRPFGMPGIVGFENGRWQGTDYLGYLTNSINVDVEVTKSANVPEIPNVGSLNAYVARIFEKENINPHGVSPLPFFHILILIYPIDKDRFAILGNGRLFEQIQVLRLNFVPQGMWQGITWETQDAVMATGEQQLEAQIKVVVERIASTFAERFNLYRESIPPENRPQEIRPQEIRPQAGTTR